MNPQDKENAKSKRSFEKIVARDFKTADAIDCVPCILEEGNSVKLEVTNRSEQGEAVASLRPKRQFCRLAPLLL